MSKEARNEDVALSAQAKELFDQLVVLVSKEGFGDLPSLATTFADIEQYGHAVGRMVARAIDKQVVAQQSGHFQEPHPCPQCDGLHPPKDSPHSLPVTTQDGELTLPEPVFHCPTCDRDFFPSARAAEDGRDNV
jgi:hypothetical protein